MLYCKFMDNHLCTSSVKMENTTIILSTDNVFYCWMVYTGGVTIKQTIKQ